MKIGEVLTLLGSRTIPTIGHDCTKKEIVKVMADHPHSRLAYVVDEGMRLLGTITIGSLMRHIFTHYYEMPLHGHGILRALTAENAQSLMDCENIFTTPEESVEEVIERMAKTGVKEMAVVDNKMRVIGDLTAVDLLRYCYEED